MSINRAEKRTLCTALLVLMSYLAMQLFHGTLYTQFPIQHYLLFHTVTEFVSFAVCFSMVFLGGIFFLHTMSVHRLRSAALFAAVGVLELAHAVTFEGLPYALSVGATGLSTLIELCGQLLLGIGLFLIFRKDDAPVSDFRRLPLFAGACAGGFVILGLLYVLARFGGSWFTADSIRFIDPIVHISTLALFALGVFTILYRNRAERPQSLLIIVQALILFFFANLQFSGARLLTDSDMLLGHLYKLGAYYFILRGIYLVTIEEPYRQQKAAEARINFLAYHDELTGLSNRRLLANRLELELERSRQSGKRMAVILLDVDRFKTINDSLGHSFGDQILKEVADRLCAHMPHPDCVFRMGGDEFTIVIPYLRLTEDATRIAQELLGLFHKPVHIDGKAYHISISIGISLYPEDSNSVEGLIKNADIAMYSAKVHRNEFKLYTADMKIKADEKLRIDNELRKALDKKEFLLMYQPLVELESRRIVGVEALIRWQHPEQGMVSPNAFIPHAEETGLILPIGDWVLREACRQNKEWQDAGLPPLTMSVNLSMRQFKQEQFIESVQQILIETGLDPAYLELEITESMTTDVEYAIETLTRLKALGVKISVDDFGTGYSSLIYLKRFPIDKLKIDRSFVSDLQHDNNDAAIVSTIATMAHNLNLRITAEGVENEAQISFLRDQQCQEAQGYFFARPIPSGEFSGWYRSQPFLLQMA